MNGEESEAVAQEDEGAGCSRAEKSADDSPAAEQAQAVDSLGLEEQPVAQSIESMAEDVSGEEQNAEEKASEPHMAGEQLASGSSHITENALADLSGQSEKVPAEGIGAHEDDVVGTRSLEAAEIDIQDAQDQSITDTKREASGAEVAQPADASQSTADAGRGETEESKYGELETAVKSTNWKERMQAFERIVKSLNSADAPQNEMDRYKEWLQRGILDANVNVQEKAVDGLLLWLGSVGAGGAKWLSADVPGNLVEKCLGQTKARSKAQAILVCLMRHPDLSEEVIEIVTNACSHKQPKVAGAAAETLRIAVQDSGSGAFGSRAKESIVRLSVQIFESTVSSVRGEALNLALALLKSSGPELRRRYGDLRPSQQNEIDKELENSQNIDPQVQGTTQSDAQLAEKRHNTNDVSETSARLAETRSPSRPSFTGESVLSTPTSVPMQESAKQDLWDSSQPARVLDRLGPDWCSELMKLPKWQQKVDKLGEFLRIAKGPRLASGDYSDLVGTFIRLLGDSMVLVVSSAAVALGLLASGLRSGFSHHAKGAVKALLDKLKDKDRRVIEAVHSALDATIPRCIGLTDLEDELAVNLGAKAPVKGKLETIKLLNRIIEQQENLTAKHLSSKITTLISKAAEDSDANVRETSAVVLAAVAARGISVNLGILDSRIKQKVDGMVSRSQSAVSESPDCNAREGSPGSPAGKLGRSHRLSSPGIDGSEPEPKFRKVSNELHSSRSSPTPASRRPKTSPVASRTLRRSVGQGRLSSGSPLGSGRGNSSPTTSSSSFAANQNEENHASAVPSSDGQQTEDREGVLAGFQSQMQSAAWKDRCEGLDALDNSIRIDKIPCKSGGAPILSLLSESFLRKKESNAQALSKVFSVVSLVADKSDDPAWTLYSVFLPTMIERLVEPKVNPAAKESILRLAEVFSPKVIVSEVVPFAESHKNPKVQSEALNLATKLCEDFGCKCVEVKLLMDFAKSMLSATNPAVKKGAIDLLIILRSQLGPDVRDFLSDVKPATLSSIDAAFDKLSSEAVEVSPQRFFRGKSMEDASTTIADQLFNLAAQVAPHVKKLGDANWKERQLAITSIESAVIKAKPFGVTGPYMDVSCGDLWAGLKARLKDSNKNLVLQVLGLIAKIVNAVGPPIEKHSKGLLPGILALIADIKKPIRDAVLECLNSWAQQVTPEALVRHLPTALAIDAPAGREDITRWTADYLHGLENSRGLDLSGLLQPVMDSLQHKITEVRIEAERCLQAVVAGCGVERMNRVLQDLKPAVAKAIKPVCDKLMLAYKNKNPSCLDPEDSEAGEKSDLMDKAGAETPSRLVKTASTTSRRSSIDVSKTDSEARRCSSSRSSIGRLSSTLSTAVGRTPTLPGRNSLSMSQTLSFKKKKDIDSTDTAGTDETEPKRWIRCNNGKEIRDKKFTKSKWLLDDPREVEVLLQALADQMKPLCEPELHLQLFSKDFKKQIDGIKKVSAMTTDFSQELIDNLDNLLKYISLRMAAKGSNTIVSIAVLDQLNLFFDSLQKVEYRLADSEGFICVHCLIDASGSNNEHIRKSSKSLLGRVSEFYPVNKLAALLIEAIHGTRNQRVRAESLSGLAELIKQHNIEDLVTSPMKTLTLVGQYVAERDVSVRNASLDCLTEAYRSLGPRQFWKLVGKMPDKDKDIVDSRLKKVNSVTMSPEPSMEKSRLSVTGKLPLRSRDVAARHVAEVDGGGRTSNMRSKGSPPPEDLNRTSLQFRKSTQPRQDLLNLEGLSDSDLMSTMRQIQTSFSLVLQGEAVDKAAGIIHEHCLEIRLGNVELKSDEVDWEHQPESTNPLIFNVNGIIQAFFVMISSSLESRSIWENSRAFLSVINSLKAVHEILSLRDAAENLNEQTVQKVLEELLWTLHDPSLQDESEIDDLVRWMNEIVVDTLHNARPNCVFTVLISLMYEGAMLSGQREPSPDFLDGVLRCLLEMSRRLPDYIDRINMDILLRDIHRFLEEHPPSKYRGREFRPLRVLKSILNELVQLKGESVRDHLTLVPVQANPTLCSYLDLVFKSRQHSVINDTETSIAANPALDNDAAVAVTEIFESIDSKVVSEAKEGYVRLRDYLSDHPEFSLDDFMARRTFQFQEHVHKNLAKVRAMVEKVDSPRTEKMQSPASEDRKMTFSELKSPAATGMLLDKFNTIKSQLEQVPVYKRGASLEMELSPGGAASDNSNDPEHKQGSAHKESKESIHTPPLNFQTLQQRIARLKTEQQENERSP